jgi:1,4-dihydroxy-6-naphthoate synthase
VIEVDENGEAIIPEAELVVEEPVAPKVEKPKESLPIPTNLPPRRADGVITLAHSPDADDAFMFYALAAGKVDTEDRRYEHVLKDIQSLNEAAKKGTYDITALSFHAYPYVRRNYALLTCGASFGDAYGPVLVAKTPIRPNEVDGMTVAMPGELTTAALVTRMWFGRAKINEKQVPFDKVTDLVRAGLVRAGVIIHEGQLTYKELGLVRVVDFGQWWSDRTEGLPLPLGGNGVRRDIPKPLMVKIALDLKRSIAYALGHREEALAHAMKYGRNLPKDKADKFVGMYVNDLTLDYGERGRQAVKYLLDKAVDEGFLKEKIDPEFVG